MLISGWQTLINKLFQQANLGDHIEIWDSAKYEAYEAEAIENFDKNAEEI